jgi:hypothetical protein
MLSASLLSFLYKYGSRVIWRRLLECCLLRAVVEKDNKVVLRARTTIVVKEKKEEYGPIRCKEGANSTKKRKSSPSCLLKLID